MSSVVRISKKQSEPRLGPIFVQVNPRIGDIAGRYLAHRSRDKNLLLNALDRGDFEHISQAGHDLLGTGGSFGFEGLETIGRSLENAAVKRQTEEIERLVEELVEYLSRVEIVDRQP